MPSASTTPGMRLARVDAGSISGIVPLEASRYTLPLPLLLAYLKRLGVDSGSVRPNLATLTKLQSAQCDFVAYENLSMHQGVPTPPLEPVASVKRVVEGRRGGYCFLVVDAYAALLVSLGFVISLHVGGVGEDPLPDDKYGNHVVLLVHGLDGEGTVYVSDVGLGDGPGEPFALRPHRWHDAHGFAYALEHRGGPHDEWHFTHDPAGSFDGFCFRTATSCAGAHEFDSYHKFYWSNTRESGYHVAGCVIQRMSAEEGILTLRNCTLRRVLPASEGLAEPKKGVLLATVRSADEWYECARKRFHLPLDETLTPGERELLWSVASSHQRDWEYGEAQKRRRRERGVWLSALVLSMALVGVAWAKRR